jgi:hypothetical protein
MKIGDKVQCWSAGKGSPTILGWVATIEESGNFLMEVDTSYQDIHGWNDMGVCNHEFPEMEKNNYMKKNTGKWWYLNKKDIITNLSDLDKRENDDFDESKFKSLNEILGL